VAAGFVDIIGSDHSPVEPSLKQCAFASAWGGIAGVQSTLPIMLDRGMHARGLPLQRVAALLAGSPAARFGIPRKGALRVGNDADIVLADLSASRPLLASDLLQRHPVSPYIGETFHGVIRRTIRRGDTIFLDGRIVAATPGRFVRPDRDRSLSH